jgi:hypothetical protein
VLSAATVGVVSSVVASASADDINKRFIKVGLIIVCLLGMLLMNRKSINGQISNTLSLKRG